MKKGLSVGILGVFLVGVLMMGIGSAEWTTITDFGKTTIQNFCTQNPNPNYNEGNGYCYAYFGSSSYSRNDACACDSLTNQVVCCASVSKLEGFEPNGGIYICSDGSSSFSREGYNINCGEVCISVVPTCSDTSSQPCGVPFSESNCAGECTEIGTGCEVGSTCSFSTPDSDIGVCTPNVEIGAYWGDLSGNRILSLSVGGTALMVVGGMGLENSQINFTINQKDIAGFWNLWNLFGLLRDWSELTQISSGNRAVPSPPLDDGIYKFNAKVYGTDIESESGELMVSGFSSNSLPYTEIISPEETDEYCEGVDINFSHQSYDVDDVLNLTWNFGNGSYLSIENYVQALSFLDSFETGNVTGRYSSKGQYSVSLTAKEKTRAQQAVDSVSIRVLGEGINVVPIISSPATDSIQGYLVNFNASQSYILNCSSDSSSPGQTFCDGALRCTYILAPGAQQPTHGTVQIRWKEIDSQGNTVEWIRGNETQGVVWDSTNYGDMVNNLNGAVIFPYIYPEPKFRRIRMEMSYVSS